MYRIGLGNDIHRLESGLGLIIGGVRVESDKGAVGHSDADVLIHAITDAIFGALAEGDIGTHFSDGEQRWKNAESFVFLRYAVGLAKEKGYDIVNVDSTISLEKPKLRPHINEMRHGIANVLQIADSCVSIKAKTGESVDAVGETRAIRADAIVMLRKTV